jgi:hypothetical protein
VRVICIEAALRANSKGQDRDHGGKRGDFVGRRNGFWGCHHVTSCWYRGSASNLNYRHSEAILRLAATVAERTFSTTCGQAPKPFRCHLRLPPSSHVSFKVTAGIRSSAHAAHWKCACKASSRSRQRLRALRRAAERVECPRREPLWHAVCNDPHLRYVTYPSQGRPPALSATLDQMVMLFQASIEIANAERWALEIGDSPPPVALQQALRRSAYEVTVVDIFHRVGRRFFEQYQYRAVWERPFQTGKAGRPEAIDIALFDAESHEETRLELGLYSKTKLRNDATKLARLAADVIQGFEVVNNILMFWEITEEKLTRNTSRTAMEAFKSDASGLTLDNGTYAARPLLASSIDLFVARSGASRQATIGLFQMEPIAGL